MKMNFVKACVLLAAAGFISSAAVAQQEKATSVDQLVEMVRKSQINESAEHKQREAEFARDKANQANLLAQAKATRAAEEARSAVLDKKYAEQQLLVTQKKQQLQERLGSMRELFGHLTSTAGDLRAVLQSSIVSAQYPNRGDFLDALIEKMNSGTTLPDIEEIERLWAEILKEVVESGKVVSFTAEVVKPSGEAVSQTVVRIGSYNLVSGGKYLSYNTETGKIVELARQPEAEYTASAFESATAATDFGVDPTGPAGGQLLTALIDKPDFWERLDQGGEVGWVIVGVGIFGVLLGVFRMLVLFTVSARLLPWGRR